MKFGGVMFSKIPVPSPRNTLFSISFGLVRELRLHWKGCNMLCIAGFLVRRVFSFLGILIGFPLFSHILWRLVAVSRSFHCSQGAGHTILYEVTIHTGLRSNERFFFCFGAELPARGTGTLAYLGSMMYGQNLEPRLAALQQCYIVTLNISSAIVRSTTHLHCVEGSHGS